MISLEAVSDALAIVAAEARTPLQWETTCQVAGALLRLSRKRSGADQGLSNQFLMDAYVDEFSRVLRGWPFKGYILLPTAFFTAGCWIRQLLIGQHELPSQEPLPRGFLPTIVDSYPAFAVVNGNYWLYASPQWLTLFRVRARDMLTGVFDVTHTVPGIEVLELAHPVPDETGQPIGTMRIADRTPLLASLDLRRFAVSFAAWGELLTAPSRR